MFDTVIIATSTAQLAFLNFCTFIFKDGNQRVDKAEFLVVSPKNIVRFTIFSGQDRLRQVITLIVDQSTLKHVFKYFSFSMKPD